MDGAYSKRFKLSAYDCYAKECDILQFVTAQFVINGHDYTRYIKAKTGITWTRENTNDEDAGRTVDGTMHPNVTSHQRKLEIKMTAMPFSVARQLEQDLQGHDDGVKVFYPDIHDGMCTRLFYNTSVKSAVSQFTPDGIIVNNLSFTLISVMEDIIEN